VESDPVATGEKPPDRARRYTGSRHVVIVQT
jgi:hypothetical protein